MFGRAPFPNIYICSMKGGGKTNLIAFIIKQIITSKTKVRIFSTTAHNDMTMKKLLEKLDKYEVIIKDYSENEGLYECMLKTGHIGPELRRVYSGFISAPVCKLLLNI
jgi:DNA helicase HerA-like ATPase